ALEGGGQVAGIVDAAHSTPAAATHGLEENRVSDRRGLLSRLVGARDPLHAGDGRHLRLRRRATRGRLVAQDLHALRRRTDETDARFLARAGERGALGEEAVARVDRLPPRGAPRIQDPGDLA